MSLRIEINSVDKTKSIDVNSLNVQNILTRQVDSCNFLIKKYGSKTYKPELGNVVEIYDGAVKIFAGRIMRIEEDTNASKILQYKVQCSDYGANLNKRLVNRTYKNKTVHQIIDNILEYYDLDDEGYTTNNVKCDLNIEYIAFKFQEVGSCFTDLADIFNFDWYCDVNKDINFFNKQELGAPFSLTDTNGNLVDDSFILRKDITKIKNQIIVKGGEYLADTFTSEFEMDGSQKLVNLGYKYGTADISFTLTGEALNFGREPRDQNASAFDAMWNIDEKVLKYRDDRIPNAGSLFKVIGQPYLPVLIKAKDDEAIKDMISVEGGSGIHEYLIIDESINSKEAARDRAKAELYAYAQTLNEGEFMTYTAGLKAGQRIAINSKLHNINDSFIINKVTYKPWIQDSFAYKISFVTTKTFGIIEFLQNLLTREKNQIVIRSDEEIDGIESYTEKITMSDTLTVNQNKVEEAETVSMADTLTAQSLDYPVEFVLGPWSKIDGCSRQFILNGSPLGPYPYSTI